MKRKSTKNVSQFISSSLILLVVIFAVGFLFYFTNNFTTELKVFYVKYGNKTFVDDEMNYTIMKDKEYKFEVVNMLGNDETYKISIIPNETSATAFTFKTDNEEKSYGDIEDLARGFIITAYDNYFIFKATKDLPEILSLYYQTSTLTDIPTAIDTDLPYFRLVISSSDMTEIININFNIKSEL